MTHDRSVNLVNSAKLTNYLVNLPLTFS